ncbi:MAG: hypothetical protein WB561_10985 [Terracidiphilus sp.]
MSEIALRANVTPESKGVTIKLIISAPDLGLQQQEDHWLDRLDILFIQRDDSGLHAQIDGQSLNLRLTSDTYRDVLTTGIPITRLVEPRPGPTSRRILVIDNNSACIGSVTIPAASFQKN